jgi:large subunit ribosomal protein L29
MATRETIELRERTNEQLSADLEVAHEALFNLRFQAATRQLADVAQVGNARRRIARIKTLLREREIIDVVERLAEPDGSGDEPLGEGEASGSEE